MAQAPIMPVFTDALIGDTTHLSTEQFGAYVLILFATWRNNGRALPDDDKRMARVCRVSVTHWRSEIRPLVVEFFDVSDGTWHQKKLEKVWKYFQKQRENGRKGGRPKSLKANETTLTQTVTQTEPKPNPTRNLHNQKEELRSSKQDSESTSNTESLNAAREGEKNEGVNPDARCAGLSGAGAPPCDRENLGAKTRMPARRADRHRDGECDETPSQAPASDNRDPALKCKCRSGGPAGTCDRSFDGQTSEVPVHHYPISRPAGQGRDNALNGEGQPETVDLPRRGSFGTRCRAGPLPTALRAPKPDFVKFKLLPKKQGDVFCEHRRYDLWADYSAATELDRKTKRPRDPLAFQQAIDAASAFIKRGDWTAESPFARAPPHEPLPIPECDNFVRRKPGQSVFDAILEECGVTLEPRQPMPLPPLDPLPRRSQIDEIRVMLPAARAIAAQREREARR